MICFFVLTRLSAARQRAPFSSPLSARLPPLDPRAAQGRVQHARLLQTRLEMTQGNLGVQLGCVTKFAVDRVL